MTRPTAKEVFLDALDVSERDRDAFLARRCSGDLRLRHEVDELMQAHHQAGQFLSSPTSDHQHFNETSPAHDLFIGDKIGPYVMRRKLGEGGFGAVYLAEQTEPVKRMVAIKVLKAGMDSEDILPRFHLERQALALMDHPGVARILEAGSYAAHRPYFVMEYVNGPPITTYCDEHRLDLRARMALFEQLCVAIRHAHQRGIIHRDLKPTNILVAETDGRPICKVIDFGIAKAVTKSNDDPSLTIGHQLIGTPQYMSPEQASGRTDDLDTRSDVYSLGAVLYELLTGVTPFALETLREAGPAGVYDLIRRTDPPSPSSRLRTLVTKDRLMVETRANARGLTFPTLRKRLRGDLDGIVMMALQRDRERRYAGADAFAKDVRRYLDHEPVLASSPGVVVHALRFARRHWLALSAVAALLLGLIVGLVGARQGEQRALLAAEQSAAVNRYMRDILGRARPDQGGGEISLLDAIRLASVKLPERFADQPAQQIIASQLVGEVFLSQTRHRDAIPPLRRAYELAIDQFGVEDPRTTDLGFLLLGGLVQGGSIADLSQHAATMLERIIAQDGEFSQRAIETRRIVALVDNRRGSWRQAEKGAREVLALAKKHLGDDDHVTTRATIDLALALKGQGSDAKIAEALHLLEPAIGDFTKIDVDVDVDALYMLGYLRFTVGRIEAAAEIFRNVLDRTEDRLSEDHTLVAESRVNLARALDILGEHEEAGRLALLGVESFRRRSGDENPGTLSWMTRALPILFHADRTEEGEEYARILYDRFQELSHGQGDFSFEYGVEHARFLIRNDHIDEATRLLDDLRRRLDSGAPSSCQSLYLLAQGEFRLANSDARGAEKFLHDALEHYEKREQESIVLDPVDIFEGLIRVADELGDATGAEAWQHRLQQYQQERRGEAMTSS